MVVPQAASAWPVAPSANAAISDAPASQAPREFARRLKILATLRAPDAVPPGPTSMCMASSCDRSSAQYWNAFGRVGAADIVVNRAKMTSL
jgi:hypothetical protein